MKRITFVAGVVFLLLAIVAETVAQGFGGVVHGAGLVPIANSVSPNTRVLGVPISEPVVLGLLGCGLFGLAVGVRGKS